MKGFRVKDASLAQAGHLQIELASNRMPVISQIRQRLSRERPLDGMSLGACLHVTKETAVLINTLMLGGAKVSLCSSNPLSTQDEVAAALAHEGVHVYAWRGQTKEEYYWCIDKVTANRPEITLDDGADLVSTAHKKKGQTLTNIKGGTEETTTGVARLRAMERAGALRYAIIAVNDANTKHLFDNRYGTGQSTIDGILRATNTLLAGKNFVVCGYGWCGKGISRNARGMGANVIITEVNPLRALEAIMDGFRLMPMAEAARIGDIFVTATGNLNVIRGEHMKWMKSGAILANSGHFNVEIDLEELKEISVSKKDVRRNLEEYSLSDGRRIYLVADGRLVNLAAAEGHPSEVMDMSFANQALSVEFISKNPPLPPKVHQVPRDVDEAVAKLKLEAFNIKIDQLTDEQERYIDSWNMGTV